MPLSVMAFYTMLTIMTFYIILKNNDAKHNVTPIMA